MSALPEYMDVQQGHKAKSRTHRGRRSRGKGPATDSASGHHAQAKAHLKNAHAAATPKQSMTHLFKALSSLKKASGQASAPDSLLTPST